MMADAALTAPWSASGGQSATALHKAYHELQQTPPKPAALPAEQSVCETEPRLKSSPNAKTTTSANSAEASAASNPPWIDSSKSHPLVTLRVDGESSSADLMPASSDTYLAA
eukprot:CAMPEP_0178454180 /NCGR_PEP_ID=MMETSP0689_2-20121128/45215_1 /TAXON_ID=160604 /ORGANISM="Amphidinium massartii, Strain CS-259" /LENGTH=111 /DNA_ID=CAMNT_0020080085 /DNA_START=562 /DNA_END=895 /DNA_ORIENTATION=-